MNGQRKKAFITGGTHGIGLAIAEKLAAAGCDIVVASRTQERIEYAKKRLSQYKVSVKGFTFDAADLSSVDRLICEGIPANTDILINNVGGGGRWGKDVLNTEWEVWEQVYNKNVGTAIKLTLAVLPHMIQSEWGRVVTIASVYGKEAGGKPWFNVAKAAEIALMKNLSKNKDLVRNGITFNTVCPGAIMIEDTGWAEEKSQRPEQYQHFLEGLPMGRIGKPEDVAGIISYLCSDEGGYINGSVITVDGGESNAY